MRALILVLLLAGCAPPSAPDPVRTYDDPGFSEMCRATPTAGTCKQ